MKGLILLNTAEFTFLHKADRHKSRKVRCERGVEVGICHDSPDVGLTLAHDNQWCAGHKNAKDYNKLPIKNKRDNHIMVMTPAAVG